MWHLGHFIDRYCNVNFIYTVSCGNNQNVPKKKERKEKKHKFVIGVVSFSAYSEYCPFLDMI